MPIYNASCEVIALSESMKGFCGLKQEIGDGLSVIGRGDLDALKEVNVSLLQKLEKIATMLEDL